MIYFETKVVTKEDLNQRSYVEVKINNQRFKEYNGNIIEMDIHPNKAKTISERKALLSFLEREIAKAIISQKYRENKSSSAKRNSKITIERALSESLQHKIDSNISPLYKRNLKRIYNSFKDFMGKSMQKEFIHLNAGDIQNFLNSFVSSNTYYMDKRRDLGVLVSKANSLFDMNVDVIKKTDRRKPKSVLHQIYDEKQIHIILNYLQNNNENLYLCCLISYGCFLRPHKEIRKLKGKHFKNDFKEIHLSGDENKSGRVRVTPIPNYVREAIYDKASKLLPNQNLFTGTSEYFNEDYFSKAWNRCARKMKEIGILNDKQTMYSFRHTAAVNVYKKTKDLHILQQLLGHSDMIVTLKYLRGLGVHNTEELRHVMPEL